MKHLYPVIVLFLLLFTGTPVQAQTGVLLSGKLTDTQKQPVSFVNLILKRRADSSAVKLAVSNEDGRFVFPAIQPGNYFIEGSLVGFKRYRSPDLEVLPGQDKDLGSLMMLPADVTLKEVNVVGTKPFVTMEPDKLVVRVDDNPLMVNSNALEVLRKSPGVVINQDDQIFLQGKSGLTIYIDGRPSPLNDKDLANWLRTIPSSQIESIELITQPSARYDASGNAGIINIRLKKNTKRGLNGSISSGASFGLQNEENFFRQNHSLNLNFGTGKLNLFGTYGFDDGKSWSFMDIYRKQSEQVFDQKSTTVDKRRGHNAKLGADWIIDKKNVLSVMSDVNLSDNASEVVSGNQISKQGNSRPFTFLDARNKGDKQNNTGNLNLNHQYKDTSGRTFTTDVNYGWYNLENNTDQPNFYRNYEPNPTVVDRSFGLETPVDISLFTLKSDYDQTFRKSTLSAGYKFANVETRNRFTLFNRANGANETDLNQSSTFSYLERVTAGYFSLRHTFNNRWSAQAGLRYEHTVSEGLLQYRTTQKDSLVRRNYGNLFPSAGLTCSINKNHSATLSYSRRVDRPVYRFLNPFQYKLDELSYEQGNPFLNPQFTHNVQLSHSWMSMINTSIGYSYTSNYFARVIDSLGQKSFLTRRNLARVNTLSFNLSSPIPITKWWNGFFNFSFNHQLFEANFGNGRIIRLPVDYYSVYLQQSIRLPAKWSAQFAFSYNSPSVWGGTFRNRSFWFAECGITKKVWKDKATLSLSITDLFLSQRWKGRSNFGGVDITVQGGNDSRQIKAGFSFNFGQADIKQIRRKLGNAEERQRLRGE